MGKPALRPLAGVKVLFSASRESCQGGAGMVPLSQKVWVWGWGCLRPAVCSGPRFFPPSPTPQLLLGLCQQARPQATRPPRTVMPAGRFPAQERHLGWAHGLLLGGGFPSRTPISPWRHTDLSKLFTYNPSVPRAMLALGAGDLVCGSDLWVPEFKLYSHQGEDFRS